MKVLERTEIEQAWANRRKVITNAIRIKHSLAADNEINKRLRRELVAFEKEVQQGILPEPLDPETYRV